MTAKVFRGRHGAFCPTCRRLGRRPRCRPTAHQAPCPHPWHPPGRGRAPSPGLAESRTPCPPSGACFVASSAVVVVVVVVVVRVCTCVARHPLPTRAGHASCPPLPNDLAKQGVLHGPSCDPSNVGSRGPVGRRVGLGVHAVHLQRHHAIFRRGRVCGVCVCEWDGEEYAVVSWSL